MTALIRIAETLRRSSDEQIADLLARHSISPSNFKDFFDLANALTQPKVISATIAALPRRLAEQLSKLIRGGEIDQASQQDLEHLLLITLQQESTDKTSATAFQHTLEAFSALTESKKSQSPLAEISSPSAPDQREIDRDAGLNAFSLLQALTELVFDIEQRYVKVIAKTSAGLPDLRRLSAHLGHPVEYIRDCFVVAERLGLIEHDDQRWRLAEGAANWLQVSASEQWALAASSWSESLGFTSEFDRQQFASKIRSSESRIDQLLLEEFPLAVGNQLNLLQKTLEAATSLGLASQNFASSWCAEVVAGDLESAKLRLLNHLPAEQNRLIVQADLSIIAPGPLSVAVERRVRRFATPESIGVASNYRISALSISHALETGMTVAAIRNLLIELSARELPQPIEYLLKEASDRFGRLRIQENLQSGGSVISSSDPTLLLQIHGDKHCAVLGLRYLGEELLSSRQQEVVYFTLREAGYVAIMIQRDGSVLSPLPIEITSQNQPSAKKYLREVAALRQLDSLTDVEPDSNNLSRKLQLAIKNKSLVDITLTLTGGEERKFRVEPLAVANGRLRALDRKSDIERTLPVANITTLEFANA